MGGRGQPQILTQVLLRLADGSSALDAVSAPRFIVGNTDVSPEAASSLGAEGFEVTTVEQLSEEMGHAQLLRVGEDGAFDAGADPRSDGIARLGPAAAR